MSRAWAALVALLLVLSACSSTEEPAITAAEAPPSSPLTTTVPPAMPLVEVPPERRLGAVYALAEADLAVPEAVEQLDVALKAELSSPSEGPRFGWFDYSETLQEAYMAALVALGPDAVPEIERRARSVDGRARAWYVIALGYLGEDVDDELITLLEDPPSRPVAAHVIEVVGRLGLEEAVPALAAYLDDDYSFQDPHRPGQPPDYPLRDIAAAALRRLGYTVYSPPERPWEYEVVEG